MARKQIKPSPHPVIVPDYALETAALRSGARYIAGVDEAGRGPLAGPVVAAAVILDPDRMPEGLDDSKRLCAAERTRLAEEIAAAAVCLSVASVSAIAVDRINILRATLLAMSRAVAGLSKTPCRALIDGNQMPTLPCTAECVVKGDQRSLSIAAASIIAKVTRDAMLDACGKRHPDYGFDSHFGYGTERHRLAIETHGPVTRLHRMSFAPLRMVAAE